MSAQKGALILIPCCKTKIVLPENRFFSSLLEGMQGLRTQLLELINDTRDIADRPENKRGILDATVPLTAALDLYSGGFYQIARKCLALCLDNRIQSINVLIVSAFYGIVELYEGLRIYDLTMADRLIDGKQIWQFWRDKTLSQIISHYVFRNNISHIWSLLPNSPQFPYHKIFNDLWDISHFYELSCYHVNVPNAGSGTGIKRAEWLREALSYNSGYLTANPFPPAQFSTIPGFSYVYERC